MAFTHTITRTYNDGAEVLTKNITVTSGATVAIDESISANQTNLLVALNIDVSQLKSLFILTDVAMTLKTNSSGSPDDTISMVANVPLEWKNDGYHTCPLTVDVTGLYVTNTTAGTLKIRGLVDPTV